MGNSVIQNRIAPDYEQTSKLILAEPIQAFLCVSWGCRDFGIEVAVVQGASEK